MGVNVAGVWDEGHAHYPGRSVVPHWAKSGVGELKSQFPDVRQKSAEAIVVPNDEGPNLSEHPLDILAVLSRSLVRGPKFP